MPLLPFLVDVTAGVLTGGYSASWTSNAQSMGTRWWRWRQCKRSNERNAKEKHFSYPIYCDFPVFCFAVLPLYLEITFIDILKLSVTFFVLHLVKETYCVVLRAQTIKVCFGFYFYFCFLFRRLLCFHNLFYGVTLHSTRYWTGFIR